LGPIDIKRPLKSAFDRGGSIAAPARRRHIDRLEQAGLVGQVPMHDELRKALGAASEQEEHSEASELEVGVFEP
jgi:hypothetical protein